MARKPSEIIMTSLRIRERLRRQLEQAAKKRSVSVNYEMASKLEYSFERESLRSLFEVAEDMTNIWARYGNAIHQLEQQGRLIHAAEALINEIETGGNKAAIGTAAEKVRQAIKGIGLSAEVARHMHTTGAGQ